MAAMLIEALIEEILIRIPPDDPASLIRASLVCKEWRRIVADPGFRRRFREFHRTDPVLALLCNDVGKESWKIRFIPTASSPLTRADRSNHIAIDARHGRVLLRHDDPLDCWFVVWDPLTRKEHRLPSLPRHTIKWNAAVLCAATPSGACDHLDCSHGPFLVVVVATRHDDNMFIHVYSSETGRWSEQGVQRPKDPVDWLWSNVLVGNELYFMLQKRTGILKYNLSTKEVSVFDLPPISYKPDLLTTTEDGRLGFATLHKSRLYLWSKVDGPGHNTGWAESRVIQLDGLLPACALYRWHMAIGFAAGVGIVFLNENDGVFSIDLKSQVVRKICDDGVEYIVPYMNFYTPELEQPRYLHLQD